MVDSVLDVYNAALSACHAKGRVTSLNENTREREECSLWYDVVVDTVQEAAFWPSSKSVEYLALDAERDYTLDWTEDDPAPQYRYRYSLPTDYLRAWHLTTYARFDLILDEDAPAVTIHTNQENAALVYARQQVLPAMWTPAQTLATVYALAAHVAGPLTGRGEIVQKNFRLANQLLLDAQAASFNSTSARLETIPHSLVARGYDGGGLAEQRRYYYPFGGIFYAGDTK